MPRVVICYEIECTYCTSDGGCGLDYCPVCGTEMEIVVRNLFGVAVFAGICPNNCDIYRPGAKCDIGRRRAS